jgi:hypothetical protein
MKRYAIVQGVEVSDEEMHVFAADSDKEHTPDMFLRVSEFLVVVHRGQGRINEVPPEDRAISAGGAS